MKINYEIYSTEIELTFDFIVRYLLENDLDYCENESYTRHISLSIVIS